jgi:hypothetical protein
MRSGWPGNRNAITNEFPQRLQDNLITVSMIYIATPWAREGSSGSKALKGYSDIESASFV